MPGGDPELERLRLENARLQAELDQFAHVASRELAAPLDRAGASALGLIARSRGALDAAAEASLGDIAGSLDRMHAIVRGLLAYYEAGRGGLRVAPTESAAALDRAAKRLQGPLLETEAALTRAALPQVWADPAALEEVFYQLLDNALKFRGEGRPQVAVSARSEGGAWLFCVSDNGTGIESSQLERVFTLFARAHSGPVPGSGIGLAVCKKIVALHGGRIRAESSPGRGTTISFTLPAER